MGSWMFISAHAFARGGLTPEEGWPEHAIELGRVLLTPQSGPSVGMVRDREMAA